MPPKAEYWKYFNVVGVVAYCLIAECKQPNVSLGALPKVRKALLQHICAKSASIAVATYTSSAKTLLTKVQDMDIATILPSIKYLSRKFPDCLETFQTVRKLSILSGNFPYCQENFQTIWKLYRPTGNFPLSLETFSLLMILSKIIL